MSHHFRELLPGPDHRARTGIAERAAYRRADRLRAIERGQAFGAAYNALAARTRVERA